MSLNPSSGPFLSCVALGRELSWLNLSFGICKMGQVCCLDRPNSLSFDAGGITLRSQEERAGRSFLYTQLRQSRGLLEDHGGFLR